MTQNNSWIELDLDVLRDNIRRVKEALRPGTEIIFIVKANAYGHGIVPVAKCASECGINWFATAHIGEALELRAAVPGSEILIVGAIDASHVSDAVDNNLLPFIVNRSNALSLAKEAEKQGRVLRCHAKIDTGMGRLGFDWQEAAKILPELAKEKGLDIHGICSHFASSSNPDRSFTDIQAERFNKTVADCEAAGLSMLFKHMSNSGAIQLEPGWDMDGARLGILLYGYGRTRNNSAREITTKPFLRWTTRIIQIKKVPAGFSVGYNSTYTTKQETCIGTINAGYADGYPRLLSNKGFIIAGGRRCPVVGRVTMNFTTIDLGPEPNVKEGDEAVLLGTQGDKSIQADELAKLCDTIPYDIITGIRA